MAATLSLARAGPDRDAELERAEFEQLYREHFSFVWRTLRRFGVADAALEDVAQEVFLVVYRRAGAWRDWSSPRSWLFGVARRVAADHRRSRDRHARKLAALPELAAPRPVDERVDDHARLRAIAAAIASLSPDRRAVYTLAELEGLSAPEIAEALELKLNTVYSKLRRARHDVAQTLAEAGFSLAHDPEQP
ncbi:MAG TPA: RNA polymerase sigma factor [Enhygromyxa sp.]|nr:RNA polymerase sigma factor [Enhygromyxa sp.]